MNTNNGSMEQSSQLGHAITSTDAMVVRATDDLWIVERSVLVVFEHCFEQCFVFA